MTAPWNGGHHRFDKRPARPAPEPTEASKRFFERMQRREAQRSRRREAVLAERGPVRSDALTETFRQIEQAVERRA